MKHKQFYIFLAILLVTVLAMGYQIIMKNELIKNKSISVEDSPESKTDEDSSTESKLIGTLEIQDGDMLERDIIPQLILVFVLAEQDVKEALAVPLASYLIREEVTDFRRMEGIIPPGSYEIHEGETLDAWSKRMVEVAESRYSNLLARVGQVNSLKPDEQIVLASIVEAECLANKQYAETAAVFLNRLADQNALQSCVTVEYALEFQRAFLYEEDVLIQHPYNTYVVSGLPAGPICCVDDQSLMAAIQPSHDRSLYYFYYDYLLSKMFFYADYTTFATEATASRDRFMANPPVGMHEKINKQTLFGFHAQ
jgi:cell division protein YceG involved in septum cleavage